MPLRKPTPPAVQRDTPRGHHDHHHDDAAHDGTARRDHQPDVALDDGIDLDEHHDDDDAVQCAGLQCSVLAIACGPVRTREELALSRAFSSERCV
jgi:hypothetical protein